MAKDVEIPCICAGKHKIDTVSLRDPLPFRAAAEMRATVLMLTDEERANTELVLAVLDESYLFNGIEAWTFVGQIGQAIPVTRGTIESELLTHVAEAMTVADVAEDLYNPVVLLPLVQRGRNLSQPGPTKRSISPTNGSQAAPPKRSKQSSISTIPMAGTERISASPAGGSR